MTQNNKDIHDVLKLLSDSDLPFEGLESQYCQHKYFKEHLMLLVHEYVQ